MTTASPNATFHAALDTPPDAPVETARVFGSETNRTPSLCPN
jgi:hypothetical protein